MILFYLLKKRFPKMKVFRFRGIPSSSGIFSPEQRFIYEGKELENDKIIFECGLGEESVVHLCLGLRGDNYL